MRAGLVLRKGVNRLIFSSPLFLFVYLPITLLAFTLLPRAWRNPFLLIVNLIFYGWGEPLYVLLMVFTTVVNFVFGYFIGKYRESEPAKAKWCVLGAVIISLGTLGFFKYAGFVTEIYNAIPFLPDVAVPQIPLPIGISFYTFQTMSYSIDVYRGDAPVQKSAVNFGVYVTLFPQLIAGPIVRYKDVAEQIDGKRARPSQFALGIRQFIIGMSKKVLLANQMGLLWDTLRLGMAENGVLAAWVGIIAYSFQIYFDFSGYSDMACGLGNMLGFKFMENFNYPYISKSITEFWRRWHISLSTWFRDYVYIPLGGNRVSKPRMYLNLFAVWFLTGLWHGASWNFIFWGLYYFVILVIEKLFLLKVLKNAPAFVQHLYSIVLILFGWTLFYFDTGMANCMRYIGAMFGQTCGLLSHDAMNIIVRYLPLLAIACIASTPFASGLWKRFRRPHRKLAALVEIALCMLGLLLCTASLVSQSYNPFLYFKF